MARKIEIALQKNPDVSEPIRTCRVKLVPGARRRCGAIDIVPIGMASGFT